MSEYQCYEFVAIDHPLSPTQLSELRAISTRAQISATRFWNEYEWGELNADPAKLVERFDAHLYFANWGTHRLVLRLPKARIEAKALKPHFAGGQVAKLSSRGEYLIIDLTSDSEEAKYDEEHQGSLAALSALRAELMRGDLRAAYLAWLLAVQADDVDETATEPPIPAGLAHLTAAQQEMIEFLRIDPDLVAAAAEASGPGTADPAALRRWVASLSATDKDAWLTRAIEDPDLALGAELSRAFLSTKGRDQAPTARTAGELRARAQGHHVARKRVEAENAKRAVAAAETARQQRLKKLAYKVDGAWSKLAALVKASRYDEAVSLAADLRDLALRDGKQQAFLASFEELRKSQIRRRGFFDRWKRMEARG